MFAPIGYRPVAELWTEFLNVRFKRIYGAAVEGYNEEDFEAAFTRGSPVDICEHIFLKSLCEVGLHVASPSGEVARVHVDMFDGRPNVFEVDAPYFAKWRKAQAKVEGIDADPKITALFRSFRSWEFEAEQNEAWADTYKTVNDDDPVTWRNMRTDTPFHTLPRHYVRGSYIVSGYVPPWANDSAIAPDVAPTIEHFPGWAFCLDEDTYQNRWPDYLSGKIELYPTKDDLIGTGRKRLEASRAAFRDMGCEKGGMTWNEVASRIEAKTGHRPSHKSLRNWQNEYSK